MYVPSGSSNDEALARKLSFHEQIMPHFESLRRKRREYVICADWNTCHKEIDLKNWKPNQKNSGFLPVEREMLTQLQNEGWVDTFRAAHPGQPDHYTWWRQFGGAREKNVGWRIDAVYASPSAAHRVTNAFIWPEVLGSDHCPVGVDLK